MARDEHDFRGDQLARRRDALLAVAVVVDGDHFDRLADDRRPRYSACHPNPSFVLFPNPGHRAGQGPAAPM